VVAAERVAVILLAAGLSTRFGAADKLAAQLHDVPLGLHVARTLSAIPFSAKIAIVRTDAPDVSAHGFTTVVNPDPALGQSGSIRLGLAEALRTQPDAVLVLLADMPFVTASHVAALLTKLDDAHPVIASTNGTHPSPPALFAAAMFDTLAQLSGDAGARTLLREATLVTAPAAELVDIDTPADLARGVR
jgi:molybdenum cofactor cytidylyltransferase